MGIVWSRLFADRSKTSSYEVVEDQLSNHTSTPPEGFLRQWVEINELKLQIKSLDDTVKELKAIIHNLKNNVERGDPQRQKQLETQLIENLNHALKATLTQLEGSLLQRVIDTPRQQCVHCQLVQKPKLENEDTAIVAVPKGPMHLKALMEPSSPARSPVPESPKPKVLDNNTTNGFEKPDSITLERGPLNRTTSLKEFHPKGDTDLPPNESPPLARGYTPEGREIKLSDTKVEKSFNDLNDAIFTLAHKLEQKDQIWRKTVEKEPWMEVAEGTKTLPAMRELWYRRRIADTIYKMLFKSSLFALDDEQFEERTVKVSETLPTPSGSAQSQRREQNDDSKTQVAKELAEQINKTLSSLLPATSKVDSARNRMCEAAVACASMLRNNPEYSWEQWDSEATRQSLTDPKYSQPAGPFVNQNMSASERKVAFMVFGAVIKNYSIIQEGEPVKGTAIINKALVVLY